MKHIKQKNEGTVIGLTGGVGSGKSLVAQMLCEACGASLLIADDLGRVVMEPGTCGFDRIVAHFGRQVVKPDGTLDRKLLSDIVFREEPEREALSGIVHPLVIEYIKKYVQERKHRGGVIVLESAILFESGCDRFCDEIWYVSVSDEIRKQRLADHRGYSEQKTQSIIAKQMSREEFLRRCDVVIENNGTTQELRQAIEKALREHLTFEKQPE